MPPGAAVTDRTRYNRTRYRAIAVLAALEALVESALPGSTDASDEEFAAALALRDLLRTKQTQRDEAEVERGSRSPLGLVTVE